MRNFYSQGKQCLCGIRLANQNKSGFCHSCFVKKYRQEHMEQILEYGRQRRLREDPLIRKEKDAEYYRQNREARLAYDKKYCSLNKEKICQRRNKYEKERKETDLCFKLTKSLRSRLHGAIKNNHKGGSAVSNLGCSIEELKKHLEGKFKPGMAWDNYGFYGWHIDHIVPLSSFDLSNPDEVKQACHYSNLQPLWAEENLQKSDKHDANPKL